MSNYAYVAIEPDGSETHGTLDVASQSEALQRLREMGLFPTKVLEAGGAFKALASSRTRRGWFPARSAQAAPLFTRVKQAHLAVFTRQLATLVEAGLPLLRSLRILEEQAERFSLRHTVRTLASGIENGDSLTEAMAARPKVFNRLYLNMVRAGEMSGALETTLARLAEFMEKSQKLKHKLIAALFYPFAVLCVAAGVLALLVLFIVPRFKHIFDGLMAGAPLPPFTRFVFGISDGLAHHAPAIVAALGLAIFLCTLAVRTTAGRLLWDRFKLAMPLLGPLFRKVAIARFAGTLCTLLGNGVPILQALNIVKDTAGNVVVKRVLEAVRENVRQGESMAPSLKGSGVFPAMVAGMVDVGEQTGALPEMLRKVADTYDTEVNNAAAAMTSILEPVLLVLLALIVGSIVIAMFLPLIYIAGSGFEGAQPGPD